MRLAIIDHNRFACDLLAKWLRQTANDHDAQILSFATVREALPSVPSLDMIWLEVAPSLRDDVAAIRAASRSLGGNLRPVILLLTGHSDTKVAALAFAARLIPVERNDSDGVRHAYRTAALMLEEDPPRMEQVITHTCPTGLNGPCLRGEAITDISFSAKTFAPIRLKIANAPAVTWDYLSRAVTPGRPQCIEGILAGISRSLFHSFWLTEDMTRKAFLMNASRIRDAIDSALATPEGAELGFETDDIFHSETVPGRRTFYTVHARTMLAHGQE